MLDKLSTTIANFEKALNDPVSPLYVMFGHLKAVLDFASRHLILHTLAYMGAQRKMLALLATIL